MRTGQTEHLPTHVFLRRLTDQTFRTPEGKAYLGLDQGRGREVVQIRGEQCRHWLRLKFQEETGKQPSPAELRSTINLLESFASQRAPFADVHVRVAPAGGLIYLDLADDRGRVVEIGPDGWKLIDAAPVHFLRPDGMGSLPVPEKGGSIDDLRSLINVDDDDFVLIVGCLLDGLRGGRSHPVLVLIGAEGTAKSTQLAILNCLIDPQPISKLPATERQLRQLGERHLFAFDNVSEISQPVADALCRLSTTHPLIINCIEDVVTCPGLADRGVFATCNSIPDERRRTEQEVWAEFERSHPQILGALLDAVAHGLRSLPTTRLDKLPRLADLARWVTACEGDLWPQGTFVAAYANNRAEAAEKLIETDVVATAVQALMAKRATWSGTATELDTTLRMAAGNLEGKGWPALPQFLAARLRVLASSLSKVGIEVTTAKVGHDRKRVITLSRIVERPDPPPTGSQRATSGNENVGPGSGDTDDVEPDPEPETEKAVDAANLADDADAADAETRTSSLADAADGAHAAADAVDEDVPTTFADAADGELVDKTTMLVGGVLIEDRCIPVYRRRRWSCKRHKLGNLERPENLVQTDLYETDRRYDADAERVLEAAITEGLEQIERTVPLPP